MMRDWLEAAVGAVMVFVIGYMLWVLLALVG